MRITDLDGNDLTGVLENWSLQVQADPVTGNEFRVNTTSTGDQTYPSVAMSHQGAFTVTWSGRGEQYGNDDTSGAGVFTQRYTASALTIGGETRVNGTTDGNQWIPSVAGDGNGNFFVAYTGVGKDAGGNNVPGTTGVYLYTSAITTVLADHDPPLVSDMALADDARTRLVDGDVLSPPSPTGVSKLVVIFDEPMSTSGGASGTYSVLNPANWSLQVNGNELAQAIQSITFGLNPLTAKYEAVLTLDGNGLSDGAPPLPAGDYVLTATDMLTDSLSNHLDGDMNGLPGTLSTDSTSSGFKFHFTVAANAQSGSEIRVNSQTGYEQLLGETTARGYAVDRANRSMAADHSGDFVVVWTRYGADDPADSQGAGVYMRVVDRNNNPLTPDTLVNTTTAGNQSNPVVAEDADGDFVVVWECQSADGSWGIYGQRFNSMGRKLGTEFRVNTNTGNDQRHPAVAMDSFGNFVVVWASSGQSLSYFNDIHGQIYNYDGQKVGSEFRVNSQNIAGTAGVEMNPSVAMNDTGDFVVTWEQVASQINGVTTDTNIMGRLFDKLGTPKTVTPAAGDGGNAGGGGGGGAAQGTNVEFQINVSDDAFISDPEHTDKTAATGADYIHPTARNAQVAMDQTGDFIVAWESYQDNDLQTGPTATASTTVASTPTARRHGTSIIRPIW